MGGFVHCHPDKVTELDQFGGLRVLLGQRVECLVNGEQFVRWRRQNEAVFGQFEVEGTGAPLLALPPSGVFHQDSSHRLRGRGEKVRPILPAAVIRTEQSQPRLMHKGRRLESMPRRFARHFVGGDAPEFLVNQREKFLGGSGIA